MNTATHTVVRTFGAVMGLAGIEHGIGEILQGDRAPTGLMILSWPDADFFRIVNGEPALTIVPNLLLTGILATLVSLAYLVWAVVFAERKNSGRVLDLLALGMLLVGGGIFPPIQGMLIGLVAARIPMRDGRRNAPTTWQQWISGLWPWSYRASIVAWLALFPGLNILGSFGGVDDVGLTVGVIVAALGSLLAAVLSALAHDSRFNAQAMSGTIASV